jgi:chromosome segregation ATPase
LEQARAEAEKQIQERALAEAEMRRQLAESSARQNQLQGSYQQMEQELADLRNTREELQGLLDANLGKFTALASELREKLQHLKGGAEPTSTSKAQPKNL